MIRLVPTTVLVRRQALDLKIHRRSFFASSTDHTRLLADAEVHRLVQAQDKSTQYVLVAQGMDIEMVKKVPQLHLGRLFLSQENTMMFGAKVVNRSLGDPVDVCGKLVDAARQDGAQHARSTLHGLSDFVLQASPNDRIVALARGKNLDGGYIDDDVRVQWERYARDFIDSKQCLEGNLYESKGGILSEILHHEDRSEFANTCRGAMALFEFQ